MPCALEQPSLLMQIWGIGLGLANVSYQAKLPLLGRGLNHWTVTRSPAPCIHYILHHNFPLS